MEVITQKKQSVRQSLEDIILDVSWAKFAKRYFDKSPSWIYHKIDGIDGNGIERGFSKDELEKFKGALYDFSERIRRTADKI